MMSLSHIWGCGDFSRTAQIGQFFIFFSKSGVLGNLSSHGSPKGVFSRGGSVGRENFLARFGQIFQLPMTSHTSHENGGFCGFMSMMGSHGKLRIFSSSHVPTTYKLLNMGSREVILAGVAGLNKISFSIVPPNMGRGCADE